MLQHGFTEHVIKAIHSKHTDAEIINENGEKSNKIMLINPGFRSGCST